MSTARKFLSLIAFIVLATVAPAQTTAVAPDDLAVIRSRVAEARKEIDGEATALTARLAAIKAVSAPATPATTGASASTLSTATLDEFGRLGADQTETLDRLRVVSSQQLVAIETLESAEATTTSTRERGERTRPPGSPDREAPSFLRLDSLKEELRSAEGRGALVETAVVSAREALAVADRELAEAETERRRIRDLSEKVSSDADRLLAENRLALAGLRSRLARERQLLRRLELSIEEKQQASHEATVASLRERLARVQSRAVFKQEDLDAKLQALETELTAVRRTLAVSRSELNRASSAWSAVRRKVEAATGPSPDLRREERTRRVAIRLHQTNVSNLSRQEEWIQARQNVWRDRFRVHNEQLEPAELERIRREAGRAMEDLDRERRLQEARVADVRGELQTLDRRMESTTTAGEKVTWWDQERQRILEKLLAASTDHVEMVATTRRAWAKLYEEANARIAASWTLGDGLATAWSWVVTVWRFEITTADDRPVTVGKILTALMLLLVGYVLARRASLWLGHQLRERAHLDEGAAAGLESLAFYTLLVSLTLAALHVAAVPLTLFTFIGGALAIGLGFGSQNIINNFISGLIILVERPIRVGDVVDVGGTFGRVSHIGARCTQVHTPTDIDILVPNSSFLESNVVNWTLGDTRVRDSVCVGVAYGSPVEEVRDLLLEAATEHRAVLADPAPFVLFTDFGASSLDFQLHYHIRLSRSVNRLTVQSDLRFAIDRLFRDKGIPIPFPQRDVHLDATAPLRVQVITNAAPEGGAVEE